MPDAQPTAQAIARLQSSTEAINRNIADIRVDLKEANEAHGKLGRELAAVQAGQDQVVNGIETLNCLVRDGNGQPSLIQRMTKVETLIERVFNELAQLVQQTNASTTAKVVTRGQVIAAIASVVVTGIATVVGVLLAVQK